LQHFRATSGCAQIIFPFLRDWIFFAGIVSPSLAQARERAGKVTSFTLKKTREQSHLAFFMQSGPLRIQAGVFDQLEETTANVL